LYQKLKDSDEKNAPSPRTQALLPPGIESWVDKSNQKEREREKET